MCKANKIFIQYGKVTQLINMLFLCALTTMSAGVVHAEGTVVSRSIMPDGIAWQSAQSLDKVVVRVSHPNGEVSEHAMNGAASLNLRDLASTKSIAGSLKRQSTIRASGDNELEDGIYKYELLSLPAYLHTRSTEEFEENQHEEVPTIADKSSGSFRVLNGQIVSDQLIEPTVNQ